MMFEGKKGSNEPALPLTALYSTHFRISPILLLKVGYFVGLAFLVTLNQTFFP